MMAHKGRGHGRRRRIEGVEYVNNLAMMVRKMMARTNVMEATQRIIISHVVRDICDDEVE